MLVDCKYTPGEPDLHGVQCLHVFAYSQHMHAQKLTAITQVYVYMYIFFSFPTPNLYIVYRGIMRNQTGQIVVVFVFFSDVD